MRRFSLRAQIGVGLALLAVLIMAVVGSAVIGLATQQQAAARLSDQAAELSRLLQIIQDSRGLVDLVNRTLVQKVRPFPDEINQALAQVEGHVQALSTDPDPLLRETAPLLQEELDLARQLFDGRDPASPEAVLVGIQAVEAAQRLEWKFIDIRRARMETLAAAQAEAQRAAAQARNRLLAAVSVAGFLGLSLALLVVRSLGVSVRRFAGALAAAATGDLTVSLPQEGRDELARLAGNFNHTMAQWRTMVGEVAQAANSLAALAQSLRGDAARSGDAAQSMAAEMGQVQGAIQQESNRMLQMVEKLRTLSAAAEGIAQASWQQVEAAQAAARKAQEAVGTARGFQGELAVVAQEAREAAAAAQDGGEGVASALAGAAEAAGVIRDVGAKVGRAAASSARVETILSEVVAIADQTNLLALNAAIEAARAGAQGRGFAVVAEEVRHLSERSRAAAQEINQMVAEMAAGMREAETAATQGEEHLSSVSDLAAAAREDLAAILAAVQAAGNRVDGIKSSAEQMGTSIESVAAQLTSLLTTARENRGAATAAEEGAQSVLADLESLAAGLEQVAGSAARVQGTAVQVAEAAARTREEADDLAARSEGLHRGVRRFRVAEPAPSVHAQT